MRLSDFQIKAIKTLVKHHFGQDASVFLFGSRTDDLKKGGDIDLFIRNGNEAALTVEAKIHFLTELKMKIGDQKVDVVFDNVITRQKKSFYNAVMLHKVEL